MVYPSISVVILNFNGFRDTKKCITSVLQSQYKNLKIIVVDNGSVRNEAELLKNIFTDKRIRFIRFDKNYGFTGGNNRILKTIREKYVVLLNNDVTVTPRWLQPIIKVLENNKQIAVAQPKILWARKKTHFDYAGACGGYIDTFGYPFTKGRIFSTQEKDTGQYDTISDVFWASGAAMVIRTSVFKKIGYFDTQFFNYMEEIDLCYRINKAGFRIVCIPKTIVYHKGAATSSKNELKKRFWEHRNNLLMITKNFSFRRLLLVLPIRFILEYVSILYYLINRRGDYASAVVLSQLSYFSMAPRILISRLTKRNKKKSRGEQYIFNNSIIFQYFIRRKLTYAKLYE